MHIYDMVIVGGGPGGYTAALYAARAGLDVLIIEKLVAGGQMALTHQIDNYPGFDDGVDGFSLGEKMRLGAEKAGAKSLSAEVTALKLSDKIKEIHTDSGSFYGKTLVLATGANPRPLGLPQEQALVGRGVHYCAACDGMFYRGKNVLVVGGGNSAAADALLLSRVSNQVNLVHRRDSLRAEKSYHAPLMQAENVKIHWNSAITDLKKEANGIHVTLENLVTAEEKTLLCDGVFVSIGRMPASELVKGQLDLDESGYVIANESTCTNLPGVYAVGDVRTKHLRQIATAVADGAVAVHHAQDYLEQTFK